jgi:hypothetical protein
MALSTLALLAFAVAAQTPMPFASDLSVHNSKLPGVEMRFVDFHWQPALFEAMEKGGSAIPEAQRNWVLARLITDVPLTIEGTKLPAGNYAVALWPNLDGKGMGIEVRRVDMREVYPNNAVAPAPAGKTVYKAAAKFEPLSPLAERLDVGLADDAGKVALTVHYGNRRLALTLAR